MRRGIALLTVAGAVACGSGPAAEPEVPTESAAGAPGTAGDVPVFQFDPTWPKPLPNNWTLGNVVGVAIDARDDIWVIHRPGSLTAEEAGAAANPPLAECCRPAPAVIEFNQDGDVVQAWGGPGDGYEWPEAEHGIFIDHLDNVWIGGSGGNDAQILKFTQGGDFLLQIGRQGEGRGSNDLENFGQPAEIDIDPETNEVFIADGYGNRRVAVFDAQTGDYKRHWGAYGNQPTDDPYTYDPDAAPSQQFGRPVHCATLSNDGLVYVCDRVNDRIQVFERDGTFLNEVVIAGRTLGFGSAFDVDFSPDAEQRYLYNIDGMNQKVWLLNRTTLEIVGSFGFGGHAAGGFTAAHSLAVDAGGNIYVGETLEGKRVQRFVRTP
ncbi:uncharacterized protein METZ01_LOCUS10065 [marine metagenome]|uniref:Peptidylamidoglycolate lyase n=1 Tax=marine metagenome TaxID=408172 RepID=A0A381NRK2_9ZZZZ